MFCAADRIGRRRTLIVGAFLKVMAGFVFALSRNAPLTAIAGAIGVITPTGGEIGPFQAVEQAALTDTMPVGSETNIGAIATGILEGGTDLRICLPRMLSAARVFGWYQFCGATAQAFGALVAGGAVSMLREHLSMESTYRCVRLLL